jgi:hypothetical protein
MTFREFFLQQELAIRGLKSYVPNCVPAALSKTGKRGGAHLLKPFAVVNPSRPIIPQSNHIFRMNQTQKKSGITNRKH